MKVIILRDTMAAGKPVKASDKPVEIPDADAKVLIAMNKAKAVDSKETKPATGKESKPAKSAPAEKEGLESELDEDPDLKGEGDEDPESGLAAMEYAELEALAKEFGIKNSPKMNKVKLVAEIQTAQKKKAAA